MAGAFSVGGSKFPQGKSLEFLEKSGYNKIGTSRAVRGGVCEKLW